MLLHAVEADPDTQPSSEGRPTRFPEPLPWRLLGKLQTRRRLPPVISALLTLFLALGSRPPGRVQEEGCTDDSAVEDVLLLTT